MKIVKQLMYARFFWTVTTSMVLSVNVCASSSSTTTLCSTSTTTCSSSGFNTAGIVAGNSCSSCLSMNAKCASCCTQTVSISSSGSTSISYKNTSCLPANCPNLKSCAAVPQPATGYTCKTSCTPVTNGTTVTNNTYACVSGAAVCTDWSPPVGSQTTPCAPCPTPSSNQTLSYWKGKCADIQSSVCMNYTQSSVSTYQGVTYYVCTTPATAVYTYSCPAPASSSTLTSPEPTSSTVNNPATLIIMPRSSLIRH